MMTEFMDNQSNMANNSKTSSQVKIPVRALNNRFYLFFYKICTHFFFTVIITLLIIMNTLALALNSYPRNIEREQTAILMNEIFTWCFLGEMIIKLLGLGVRDYLRDAFNIFDACLVILSMVDEIL